MTLERRKLAREFSVVIEKDEDGYFVASVPALPGCHTQAKSLDVLMKRIREAIELCLEVERTCDDGYYVDVRRDRRNPCQRRLDLSPIGRWTFYERAVGVVLRLMDATLEQRSNFEIIGNGLEFTGQTSMRISVEHGCSTVYQPDLERLQLRASADQQPPLNPLSCPELPRSSRLTKIGQAVYDFAPETAAGMTRGVIDRVTPAGCPSVDL